MEPTLVLTGATGFIGTRVAQLAKARGFHCLALVRATSNTAPLKQLGIDIVPVDLDADDLGTVLPERPIVVHMGGPGLSDLLTKREGEREGISNLLTAARNVQAKKFLYLSSIKARPPQVRPGMATAYAPDIYTLKKAQEERILIENAGDTPWTIIRAPAVFGFPDKKSRTIFNATSGRLVPVLPKGQAARFSMIHVDDLASKILDLGSDDQNAMTIEVANAPPVSWNDVAAFTRRQKTLSLPIPAAFLRFVLKAVRRVGLANSDQLRLIEDRVDDITRYEWIAGQEQTATAVLIGDAHARLEQTAQQYREAKS